MSAKNEDGENERSGPEARARARKNERSSVRTERGEKADRSLALQLSLVMRTANHHVDRVPEPLHSGRNASRGSMNRKEVTEIAPELQ